MNFRPISSLLDDAMNKSVTYLLKGTKIIAENLCTVLRDKNPAAITTGKQAKKANDLAVTQQPFDFIVLYHQDIVAY